MNASLPQNQPLHDLTIAIPAYNEQTRIHKTLDLLHRYVEETASNYEVLIVDDGSTDETAHIAKESIVNWPRARLIRLPRNQGKGAAIRAAVLHARKPNFMFLDADNSTALEALPALFSQLSDTSPIVIGSRDIKGSKIVVSQPLLREYPAKALNLWIQLWLLPGIWDTQCGFKLFRTKVARQLFRDLKERGFGFDIEILYRARCLGLPILELPVTWSNAAGSHVKPLYDGPAIAWQVVSLRLQTALFSN